MTPKYPERIAVFAGTFRPFTVGHADIVERGLRIFDRIIICIGVNYAKPEDKDSAEERAVTIKNIYAADPRITVECYSGITTDFAIEHGACALLRGVRSVKDYEYERDLADANLALSGIDTVILYTRPQLGWVSSSLVRELQSYGRDVSSLLPSQTNNKQTINL